MKPIEIVNRFIQAINQQDVDQLLALTSSDHKLIDGGGDIYTGSEKLHETWSAYFQMFPDYKIVIEKSFSKGDSVGLYGTAEGTYAPDGNLDPTNHWKIPAAWLAVVSGDFVVTWQVYADNWPVHEIMSKYK